MFAVFVILPQFCLILLGYLLTRRPSFAKKDFWIVTEKLVFYVLFPPLIFLSVAKANLQIGQCSYFLLISISAMSVAVITAWLANFLIKESRGQNGRYFIADSDSILTSALPFAQRFSAIKVSPTFPS